MDNVKRERPKMPKLESDLANFAKRSVMLENKKTKEQGFMNKALKKREIRMARLEKKKQIADALDNLKTLRMELKMIKLRI